MSKGNQGLSGGSTSQHPPGEDDPKLCPACAAAQVGGASAVRIEDVEPLSTAAEVLRFPGIVAETPFRHKADGDQLLAYYKNLADRVPCSFPYRHRHESGVVVRMAELYELFEGPRTPEGAQQRQEAQLA